MASFVILEDAGGRVLIFETGHENLDESNISFIFKGTGTVASLKPLLNKLYRSHIIRVKQSAADVSGVTNDATLLTYLQTNDYDDDYTLIYDL